MNGQRQWRIQKVSTEKSFNDINNLGVDITDTQIIAIDKTKTLRRDVNHDTE